MQIKKHKLQFSRHWVFVCTTIIGCIAVELMYSIYITLEEIFRVSDANSPRARLVQCLDSRLPPGPGFEWHQVLVIRIH